MQREWVKLLKRWLPRMAVAAFVLAASLFLTFRIRAQRQGQVPPPSLPSASNPVGPDNSTGDSVDPEVSRMRREQAMLQNDARQRQLVQDTDKLFELAKELKEEVGKTNKDTLSVEVIKKAGEIEKLAKSVREKMKGQ